MDGTNTITNTYDVDGIRQTKTVNGVGHKYVTLDGKVTRETYGNVTVDYFYDNDGSPLKIEVNDNGTTYTGYYVLNQQGDVIGIIDAQGNVLVKYFYNAWGLEVEEELINRSAEHPLKQYNALKYRGYYYDADLGLYYLSSRYYDPVIGRFINADDQLFGGSDMTGMNLYTYCGNNPVNRSDEDGHAWKSIKKRLVNAYNKAKGKIKAIKLKTKKNKTKNITRKANSIKLSISSIANIVTKSHVTTPTYMCDGGMLIGKVGFSATTTKQNKESAWLYGFSDRGNDSDRYGIGINCKEWLGVEGGVSTEMNLYVGAQVTPWIHAEVSFGFDGLGGVVGVDIEDTSYDFEIKGGWGTIVAAGATALGANPEVLVRIM